MLLQFHHPGGTPTLQDALATFDLRPDEIDAEYGVVATDADAGLYVVRVSPGARAKVDAALAGRPEHPAEGLFADPRVEPTDPSS